jgi:acetyl-CoA C-acetyltransferase
VQAGNKMNPARQAAIHAGLPVQVPAMTVNRVCGSGAQVIVSAAHEIQLGSLDTAVAGGMENMDVAPYVIARGRWGHRMGDGVPLRQCPSQRAQRRLLGRTFGLAYRVSGREVSA